MKYDLSNQYINEFQKYQELYQKGTSRTSTGSLSFTSTTSGTTYSSTTGEAGIFNQLQTVLLPYMLTAQDYNSIYDNFAAIENSKVPKSDMGIANGVATLDKNMKLNVSQLPSSVAKKLDEYIAAHSSVLTTVSTDQYPRAMLNNTIACIEQNTYVTGSVIVSASSTSVSGTEWYAFDLNAGVNDCWESAGTAPAWLKVKCDKPIVISKYIINAGATIPSGYNPKSWTFEGSNDDTNWTVLDTKTNYSFSTSEVTCTFTNTTPYLYYRINVTATYGTGYNVSIYEFKLYKTLCKSLYNINSNNKITSYTNGLKFIINTDTSQYQEYSYGELQVDTLGYKKVFGDVIFKNRKYIIEYSSSLDSGNGGWIASPYNEGDIVWEYLGEMSNDNNFLNEANASYIALDDNLIEVSPGYSRIARYNMVTKVFTSLPVSAPIKDGKIILDTNNKNYAYIMHYNTSTYIVTTYRYDISANTVTTMGNCTLTYPTSGLNFVFDIYRDRIVAFGTYTGNSNWTTIVGINKTNGSKYTEVQNTGMAITKVVPLSGRYVITSSVGTKEFNDIYTNSTGNHSNSCPLPIAYNVAATALNGEVDKIFVNVNASNTIYNATVYNNNGEPLYNFTLPTFETVGNTFIFTCWNSKYFYLFYGYNKFQIFRRPI